MLLSAVQHSGGGAARLGGTSAGGWGGGARGQAVAHSASVQVGGTWQVGNELVQLQSLLRLVLKADLHSQRHTVSE